MKLIPRADAERAMKVQEVILRAMAKSITWGQAAEILDFSARQMRRRRRRYERFGYDGLWDRRRGRPSPRRVPLAVAEQVLQLYRETYTGFNVRHFHEKLQDLKIGRSLRYARADVQVYLEGCRVSVSVPKERRQM